MGDLRKRESEHTAHGDDLHGAPRKVEGNVIDGAFHVVMISHPEEVAEVILAAAGE
jgi:pimeloyl-ACP methyl ester carboxylesterase